jgi:hypothetical protein
MHGLGNAEQAENLSARNRLCAFLDVELHKNILHVGFDRLGRNRER